jgi:Ca2+-binding EF-hand superfamily protein|eukprot:g8885.t1
MGKAQSRMSREATEKALKYFEAHEINEIVDIFNRLQDEKNESENGGEGKSGELRTHAGIDIDTFGEYFSYPGVLREQIFKVFDTNGDGFIDREEFMRGLAMCCKGELNDKLRFCFSMFDLSGDGYIDRAELHRCLASTAFASFALLQAVAMEQGLIEEATAIIPAEFEKEVNAMVDDAFRRQDINDDGKLSYEEFKRWICNTPEIIGIVYSVFEMRGHIDMEIVRKQFDDSRKLMENKLGLVKRMQEMKAAKEAAERKAVALAAENSRLAERLEELENENRRLREVAEEKGINVNSDKK